MGKCLIWVSSEIRLTFDPIRFLQLPVLARWFSFESFIVHFIRGLELALAGRSSLAALKLNSFV